MIIRDIPKIIDKSVEPRALALFTDHKMKIYKQTDRLFMWLMIFQWIFGIFLALVVSPRTWIGSVSQTHIHVWAAVFLGGAIAILPVALVFLKPGEFITRNVIAVSQMLFSGLLIHLTGGRIETHFHVFGSLAFLAFYRDWRIFIPATIVVALDHMIRGAFWPQSVFGVLAVSQWRWVEHTAWVVFEDVFLMAACRRGVREMWQIAERTAQLEVSKENIEMKVRERTLELLKSREKLAEEMAERKKLEHMVIQSEKMAAVGQLAAGVAHEINNPIGFISNNMEMLAQYVSEYAKTLEMAKDLQKSVEQGDMDKARGISQTIGQYGKEVDLDHTLNDVGNLLEHNQRGLERVRKIVSDLKTFAREGSDAMESVRIEEIIDGVVSIVHNESKYKAELRKNYGNTPLVRGNPQRLGQVFINLFVNAIQAIEDKGTIKVATFRHNGRVCVEISDTGRGIAPENLEKIFDPFFTTKPVGQGTGLGLSVSYEIIKKHGGDINVQSQVGAGTTFTVRLPMAVPAESGKGANI